jgi:mono/diheme cytochrome c family protein
MTPSMRLASQRSVLLAMQLLIACAALASCEGRGVGSSAQPAASVPPAIRYEAHLAAGGGVPPGAVLRNPNAGNSAVAKSGGSLFVAMNCNGCHGDDAAGWVAPSLSDGRWRYGGSDAEIFNSIYFGRAKGMPAFGGVLNADGVWVLVTYIQSLPVPPGIATESWEAQ